MAEDKGAEAQMFVSRLQGSDEADAPEVDVLDPDEEIPVKKPGIPQAEDGDVPGWALVPQHLKIPRGVQVVMIRIKAEWTVAPQKGDRCAICWPLSDGDEKLASDRTDGKQSRAPSEFSKQMIRAVDGVVSDWMKPRGAGSVDEFWREIGPKGRNLVQRVYMQINMASEEEQKDFFESCIAVRTAS